MAPYQEYRNPVTGQVTATGANPYKQQNRRYGNRAQGVRQAASARKQLMKLRRESQSRFTPEQQQALAALSQQFGGTGEVTQDTRGPMGEYQATAADTAAVAAQQQRIKERNAQVNPETGRNYRAGMNLGLSQNEIAFNQSVRRSKQGTQSRINQIRDRLDDVSGRQKKVMLNRLGNLQKRRDNFGGLILGPQGAAAPKPPARQRQRQPKRPGGPSGGFAP